MHGRARRATLALEVRAKTTEPFGGCKPSRYGVVEIAVTTSSDEARRHRLTRFSLAIRPSGLRNDQIAAQLQCGRDVVSQWRKRFFERGLAGLEDRPRRDRPPVSPPQVRTEVIRLACELPADSDVPLARWSCSELASEAVARGIAEHIAGVTRRAPVSTPTCPPRPATRAASASSTSTSARGRCATWPHGTFAAPDCLTAAPPKTASSRSTSASTSS